jgi:hypothetical protein
MRSAFVREALGASASEPRRTRSMARNSRSCDANRARLPRSHQHSQDALPTLASARLSVPSIRRVLPSSSSSLRGHHHLGSSQLGARHAADGARGGT